MNWMKMIMMLTKGKSRQADDQDGEYINNWIFDLLKVDITEIETGIGGNYLVFSFRKKYRCDIFLPCVSAEPKSLSINQNQRWKK